MVQRKKNNRQKMKRWKYRKITPEDKEFMRLLRKEKLYYSQIAEVFDITNSTAQYHCKEKYRQHAIRRAKNRPNYGKRTNSPKYLRDYMIERYRNDMEFNKRVKKGLIKSAKKRSQKARELAKANPKVREKLRAYWRGEIPYSEVKSFFCLTELRK